MKSFIKFVSFLAYSIIVFLTYNFYLLGMFCILNCFIMLIAKISIKKASKNLFQLAPFILLTAFMNYIVTDLNSAILFTVRLIIICNITFSFSKTMTSMELAQAIEMCVTPLKLIKINPKDISLIICIGVAFIPILTKEFRQIKYGLKAKGMNLNLKTMKYALTPYLYGILKRTDEVTNALKAKAFIEE